VSPQIDIFPRGCCNTALRGNALVEWNDETAPTDYREHEVFVQYSVWFDLGTIGSVTLSPGKEVTVERELAIHGSEIDAAFEGKVVPAVLEEIGIPNPNREAKKFVSQLRKLAKADGFQLSDEEASALANIMFLVGRKLADELE